MPYHLGLVDYRLEALCHFGAIPDRLLPPLGANHVLAHPDLLPFGASLVAVTDVTALLLLLLVTPHLLVLFATFLLENFFFALATIAQLSAPARLGRAASQLGTAPAADSLLLVFDPLVQTHVHELHLRERPGAKGAGERQAQDKRRCQASELGCGKKRSGLCMLSSMSTLPAWRRLRPWPSARGGTQTAAGGAARSREKSGTPRIRPARAP